MLKFTMYSKELKTMMEKGTAAINKKATLSSLTRLYFQVEADGTVKALGTDLEHYAEIRSNNAWNTSPGVLGIDTDDIKVLSKMSGDITLEDVSTEKENKINVKCGKKSVMIPKYDNVDIFLPSMDDSEKHILTMKESWLLETISNLAIYTSDADSNKLMQVFNFNTECGRVEALEGHVIGMRSLENQSVLCRNENVMIHRKCLPVFKKTMDKKSDAEVKVYQDKKYIRVEGKDFTYIVRKVVGKYFDVGKMLTDDYNYRFIPKKDNILEVMKYNYDLAKDETKPVIIHSENGKLYSYMRTSKYEMFDEIETKDFDMNDDFYIGFNPHFLADAFDIVDSESPECRMTGNKSPLFIKGNEYSFVILPVVIDKIIKGIRESISEHINRSKAA